MMSATGIPINSYPAYVKRLGEIDSTLQPNREEYDRAVRNADSIIEVKYDQQMERL